MLNGALIGFGKIAQHSHLVAYEDPRIRANLKITSVVEPNDANREVSKIKYPQFKFYKSFEELLKENQLDFIDITTPPKFHKDLIEQGIKNNLNIISEKPFTLTLNEAIEIRDKLELFDKIFIPCHQYKYLHLWKEFKKVIEKTNPGDKALLQFNVFRQYADPGLEVFNNPWRTNKEMSGGGILADTGVHYLYLSIWLLGKPIKVTAHNLNLAHPQYGVEDTSTVIIEFERGVSQITLTWGSNTRFNSANLVSKNYNLNYSGGTQLLQYSNNKEEIITVPDPSDKVNYTSLYVSMFNEFINKINSNTSSEEDINEAFESIKLLEACYLSAQEERTIVL